MGFVSPLLEIHIQTRIWARGLACLKSVSDLSHLADRFHHGGNLQQKPRIKYEGCIVIDCFDVDVDKLSYFEFVDIVKEIGYNCSACVVYIKPPKCRHVVEVKSDRDIMGLGFEETAQPAQFEESVVGEELGEVLGRTSTDVGEDLGRAFFAAASDVPEVGFDWESETEANDNSDNADLSNEGEDKYGSDVHEEVINLRKEKRAAKIKKRKEKGPRSEVVDLEKKRS
ncbi:hypothetical protein RDI58_004592 [Solanum bulbocastanum]|uniref:PB1-like domain-containing protein n=1 Tax=Solanum bulbocastanum TaxID=147425 RepID=A0AAN8U4U7_SOLBU